MHLRVPALQTMLELVRGKFPRSRLPSMCFEKTRSLLLHHLWTIYQIVFWVSDKTLTYSVGLNLHRIQQTWNRGDEVRSEQVGGAPDGGHLLLGLPVICCLFYCASQAGRNLTPVACHQKRQFFFLSTASQYPGRLLGIIGRDQLSVFQIQPMLYMFTSFGFSLSI